MSLRKNAIQQLSFHDSLRDLTERERKFLESSWAAYFAENIFPELKEEPFAPLYADRSHTNAPVNVTVGALLLKEVFDLTDRELLESVMFDVRFQYALRTTSFEEQPLSERTLNRFRSRLAEYKKETSTDLLEECRRSLAGPLEELRRLTVSGKKGTARCMQDILLVIDMQNDFIDGALGTKEAVAVVPKVKEKIEGFEGTVLFTRDTHEPGYLETQEGRNLPVPHCIRGTDGWQIRPELDALRTTDPIDKVTFGSSELGGILCAMNEAKPIRSITLIGLCTDICVISNAMLVKAFLPEVPVIVDASCCAGVTPESHENALKAMEVCQIRIVGRE